MAGGTAHEFNNLLTMIMGYSALMLSSIDSQTKIMEYVECIRNASARAGRLTHQLLAFGRKQLLSPQVLELNSLLADMSRLIAEITKEGVECQIVASSDPAWICVDPAQMEQVIGNLLNNARNAMPRGGKITITVRMVEFSRHDVRPYLSLAAGQYAELSVSDTGTGMSAEVQARIFEPFFSTKGRAEATGMGLATAYGIITQSGGTMSVQSELGSGTTMRIYLPQPAESDIAAARTRSSYSDWLQGSETILLVEDQPQLLSITSEFLRKSGYTIIAAANADQALLSSDGFPGKIDLLITDIVMPGMDGHKLAIRLKALRPGIPVLYVSGYIDDAFVELPLTTDEAFMLKPFTLEALGLKIREMLQRGKIGPGRRWMQ
jgi:CheY-like chemotaxis protein